MIEVGKWVSIRNRNAIGFILESTNYDAMVCVIQDGKATGDQRFNYSQLTEMTSVIMVEEEEDLKRLHINMALDTGDKEWLTELSQAEGSK
ncbi:hypothetical protein [Pseudobacillus badius]|uniref:hypothetical protein n=1 Tax=Bacillus badius TaxID=1455 RepID=UPI0024A1015B|nr:hypothetical protein [Bacillus badius]GLY11375.1 hypothetical protein Bbad01_25910 [Bacillus badius]